MTFYTINPIAEKQKGSGRLDDRTGQDLLFAVPPPENRLHRRPQLLLQHGRFWLRSTLHSHCTDSVARWSPMAPLSCVNSVRGLSEPPELHQRLGSGSWQPLAVRSAAGPGGEGRLPERSVRDLRAQGPRTTRETR